MFKTRTRMLSFRLSEDEYERLRNLSVMERARSVSDFARSTLCSLPLGKGASSDPASARMDGLEGEIRQLRVDMQKLGQQMEARFSRAVNGVDGAVSSSLLKENQ